MIGRIRITMDVCLECYLNNSFRLQRFVNKSNFRTQRLPEWRNPRYRDRTHFSHGATVQLATPDSCLVVHLVRPSGRHSRSCVPILKAVLEDECYVKAGCGIDADLLELHDLWGNLDAKSRFDLGVVVPQTGTKSEIRNKSGLKRLCRSILGLDLPKEKADSQTDWASVPLNDNQIIYAARDAWAGAAIVKRLAEFDANVFGHQALIDLLQQSETPMGQLSERRVRRKQAKRDLDELLLQYESSMERLPKRVGRKAQGLREIINARVIDQKIVFQTHHLDGDKEY
jgi:hypothetical protein